MALPEEPLEADWVSVRPQAFQETRRSKLVFIVAWNEVEGKFALTCHDRTAQRRRSGSRGEPGSGRPSRGEGAPEPGDEGSLQSLGPEPPEEPEEECSWAGLFSCQDLRALHAQLCSVSAELEAWLPALPAEPAGVWAALWGEPRPPPMEGLCRQLQLYLGHALDTCGWKILRRLLFSDSADSDEYYESLSELRRRGHEEALLRARRHLQELLETLTLHFGPQLRATGSWNDCMVHPLWVRATGRPYK